MAYQPIEDYGIIGNMRTVALVGKNGSIDWYCYPQFDSPSVFGAILDDKKGGRFQVSAVADDLKRRQFYWPSTNVLVTRFLLTDGIAEMEDFMPAGLPSDSPEYRHLYRRIRCVRGTARILAVCRPAFDYGRRSHETAITATGAVIAAPTASLPEVIGGARNWDYRYTWIRDAAFTVYGFLRIGFKGEAAAFMAWLEDYASKHARPNAPGAVVYTIDGDNDLPEQTLDHWEGYRGSGPVRIGNAAVTQFQGDIYGELMDAFYLANKYVSPTSYDIWVKIRKRLDWICDNWQRPDAGIWEMRNRQEHFVYSKVMNWVALDRGLRLAEKRALPANRDRWISERDKIYEEVMGLGWNVKRGAFTQFYGSDDLDASLLIMPLVFFMAPGDPRIMGTINAILEHPRKGGLLSDSSVYRYPPEPRIDGLPGEEGTFTMCSFWLVEALTRASLVAPEKLEQARLLFERVLGYANHLGLYSEQTGPQGEALGNFPQAFTHLALISAAWNLERMLGSQV